MEGAGIELLQLTLDFFISTCSMIKCSIPERVSELNSPVAVLGWIAFYESRRQQCFGRNIFQQVRWH